MIRQEVDPVNYEKMKKLVEKHERLMATRGEGYVAEENRAEAEAFERTKVDVLERVAEWLEAMKHERPIDDGVPIGELKIELTQDYGLICAWVTETRGPDQL